MVNRCVLNCPHHLLVVLLQVDQLLLQPLDLQLQVGGDRGQLVPDPPQPCDVRLHRLPHQELVVVPVEEVFNSIQGLG